MENVREFGVHDNTKIQIVFGRRELFIWSEFEVASEGNRLHLMRFSGSFHLVK